MSKFLKVVLVVVGCVGLLPLFLNVVSNIVADKVVLRAELIRAQSPESAGGRGAVHKVDPYVTTLIVTNRIDAATPIVNMPVVTTNLVNMPAPIVNLPETDFAPLVAVVERLADVEKIRSEDEVRNRVERELAHLRDVELKTYEDDRRRAYAALFAINHVNWVVTKIKNYNDPAVLEEEYKNISSDALNLNAIKDHEVIDVICDIMDVITDMRIESKEREMLREELDQGMSDAIYEAFSGISTGSGVNPVSMVFNVISSAATSAMNYKKAKRRLMQAYGKKTWELDKDRMRYLNELNKSLLQKYWALVQRYDIQDSWRVTEADVALLIDHLKDENVGRRYDFLSSMQDRYAGLQNYWFYRGVTAYECGNLDDAKYSLNSYRDAQREYGGILRIDGVAARAAMLRIRMMIDDGVTDADAYTNELAIVERNSTIDEWQNYYFCGLVYINQIRSQKDAERVLKPVVTHLDYLRNRRLVDWKDLVCEKKELSSTNTVDRLVPSGDALFECRKLLADAAKGSEDYAKRLDAICAEGVSSSREKLFCYFSMSYDKALERLKPEIGRICLYRNGSDFRASLPMSWVLSREGASYLTLGDADRFLPAAFRFASGKSVQATEVGERSVEEREDGLVCATVDYALPRESQSLIEASEVRKAVYTIRYDRGNGGTGANALMLAVEFDVNKQDTIFRPRKAYLGPWCVGHGLREKSGWQEIENGRTAYVTVEF